MIERKDDKGFVYPESRKASVNKKFICRLNDIRVLENPALRKFGDLHLRRSRGLVKWFQTHSTVLMEAWRLPIKLDNRGFHIKYDDPNPLLRQKEVPQPTRKRPVPTSSRAAGSSSSGGVDVSDPPIPAGTRAPKYKKVKKEWVINPDQGEASADLMDMEEGTSSTKPCRALCPGCLDVDRMSYCILSQEPFHGSDH